MINNAICFCLLSDYHNSSSSIGFPLDGRKASWFRMSLAPNLVPCDPWKPAGFSLPSFSSQLGTSWNDCLYRVTDSFSDMQGCSLIRIYLKIWKKLSSENVYKQLKLISKAIITGKGADKLDFISSWLDCAVDKNVSDKTKQPCWQK